METTDLEALTARIRKFAEKRDWEQYHTPKNLTMALSVEVGELMEHFQWLSDEEARAAQQSKTSSEEIPGELADVAIYLLRLADVLGVDLRQAVERKMDQNEHRFPAEEVRGRATPGRSGSL